MPLTTTAQEPGNRLRFVVVGPGALGSVVAAHLARAGYDVTLLGRPSPHLHAVREHGLTLESPDRTTARVPLAATDDPDVVAGADVIVVLVKTGDTETALRAIAPHVRPGHVLLTMQNGLGGVARIRAVLGDGPRVLPGVTWQAATRLAPGVVRHAGAGPTAIGYRDARDGAVAERIAAAFAAAGLPAKVEPDIARLIWQKAAVNAAINGLTALAEIPNGDIVADPALLEAAETLAEEAASVARASGIPLGAMREALIATAVASTHNRSSMLQDLDAGRRTEVEAIHGAILRAAATHDIAVPALTLVTALIRAKERSREETRDNDEHGGARASRPEQTDRG
jgi:2-dehydropantoate 2-reductase